MPGRKPIPLVRDVCSKLSIADYEGLLEVSQQENRSRSEVVRTAIVSYLKKASKASAKASLAKSESRAKG